MSVVLALCCVAVTMVDDGGPLRPKCTQPAAYGTWSFDCEVETIGGVEGQWLRTELAKAVADLARWAYWDLRTADCTDWEESDAA